MTQRKDGAEREAYSWCQLTEKLPPLIADGVAFTVAPEAIVICSIPGVELVSRDPSAEAALNPIVPKSDSGRTFFRVEGASAITSAEASLADLRFFTVVCDHPCVVSVSVS